MKLRQNSHSKTKLRELPLKPKRPLKKDSFVPFGLEDNITFLKGIPKLSLQQNFYA
jgi:hypothetical protein